MSFTRALRAVGAAAAAGALLFAVAPAASADQVRDDQWPLKAYVADKVWSEATGKGVTVAVIDGGFKADHPDLTGQFLKGKDFIDGDSSVEPDPSQDKPEHGTAMAGIIAAHGHGAGNAAGVKGLAPDAKLLPIRDDGGNRDGLSSSIRYAVDQGASVINISLGITTYPEGNKGKDADRKAIAYALDHGVLVVAGTGNQGVRSDGTFPAAYPGVLTVGAVDGRGDIWKNSNYGDTLVAAPGVKIVTTGLDSDGYDLNTGTSDATAYTSAAAALLKQKYPDLAPGQIANRLVKTAGLSASAKGASLPDEHYGYGFIKPYSALAKNIPAGSKNGPLKVDELNASIANSKGDGSPAPSSSSVDAASDSADSGGISTGTVIGIAAGALVILVIVVFVIARSRKNNGGGPPPPHGGGWSGGGHQSYPTHQQFPGQQPYPTQQPPPNPYQQQAPPAPYPQQAPQAPPAPPGSYPQPPSQPPYGQG
ncbi:S8 family serine peptidase [Streptomyces sp. NBC_00356]|uniref:S8 family serine peptidase n=1 Tax=Streptomyces sp. NBC_00356 TaxID=2975724 RepID=UPI002E264CBA